MIMVCRDQNIRPSFNSAGWNDAFSLKTSYIAILCSLGAIPLTSFAGEYFNPHLLEVNETSATSVDLSYISREAVPLVSIILIFILTTSLSLLTLSSLSHKRKVVIRLLSRVLALRN